jgi:hypothetical protein
MGWMRAAYGWFMRRLRRAPRIERSGRVRPFRDHRRILGGHVEIHMPPPASSLPSVEWRKVNESWKDAG